MSDKADFSESGPEFLAMTAAIFSEKGRAAAIDAAAQNKPPLAGVDPMLTETFVRYRNKHRYTLNNAGFIVARLMRELGYAQGKSASCPDGCTAATGAMFYDRSSH